MSQEVDERVVKLSFDNAKFEKNVQQSIRSLNALNDSLRLEGAEKGFAEVEKASERVDFDRMQGAVETLQDKFSALEVIGVAALVKITNQAIDAGERLAKNLSIDQVTAGWGKYAEKTASVQTIMNATGKSIKQVNRYLDKLMWYSDETSYSFNDMTSALGSMTSSGGDIDTLIPMLEGIANATAYAGKGAAEFKRVMYNLNQAYSLGYLGLQDWNSVSGAGVDSAQLIQTMIDTAVDLGKLKKGEVTINSFRNSLSKKWLDRSVMEASFRKFSKLTEAAYDAVKAGDFEQASEAIEALSGDYDELSVTAFKSAQSAKTFKDAIDATKDAVSSGWMDTFGILFGDYKEAETFWTDVANTLYDIFASGKDARNSWLKAGFDSGLDQLLNDTALGDVGDSFTTLLQKSLVDSGKLTSEGIDEAGSFQKALEEAGITAEELYEQVQMYLDVYKDAAKMSDEELAKRNVSRETLEKTIAAYEKMAEEIQNGKVNLEGYADQMSRMSGREHFYSGILNILEGINSVLTPIRAAFNEVFMTDGSPLYNLLKGFDELTAKFQLSEESAQKVQSIFKGVFSVLSVGFKTIKTAGRIALAVLEALLGKLQPLGDLLLSVGAAFGNIFTELNDSLNHAGSLEDVIDAIATAFGRLLQPLKDVFGALKALVTGSSIEDAGSKFGAFGKIISAVNGVFQNFGLGTISLSGLVGKALRVLGGIFFAAFDGVRSLITNAFGGFAEAGKAVEDFKDKNLGTLEEVRDTVVSLPEKAGAAMKAFAGNVQSSFYTVADACKTGLEAVKNFFDMQDLDLYRLLSLLDVGLLAAAIWSAAEATKSFGNNIKAIFKNPIADFFTSMSKAVDSWTAAHTSKNLIGAAKAISTSVALIAGSIYLVSRINDPVQLATSLGAILAAMFGMVVSLRALADTDLTGISSMKLFGTMSSIALGMVALSAAMGTIYAVISAFGRMDQNQLQQGTTAMVNLVVQLGICIAALGLANSKLIVCKKFTLGLSTKGAGSFVAAALGLAVLAGAIVAIGKAADTKTLNNATKVIKATALALSACVIAMGVADWMSQKNGAASAVKAIAMIGKMAMLATAIGALGGAIAAVAGAVLIFSRIGNLWSSVAAAGAVLAGLVTAIMILGKNELETTVAAVSILALSGALIGIAAAVNMLAGVPFNQIWTALSWLAAALMGLVTAAGFLPVAAAEILTVAKAIGLLAASLLILTPAFKGLGSIGWQDAIAGLIGLAGIVGSVLAMSAAIAFFPQLGAALVVLGKACDSFATSALKLSAGLAIIAGLSFFAGPISQAIMGAAPDIELALLTILQVISDVLVLGQEYIVAGLTALIEAVVQTIINLIGWAWDGNGAGGGIKQALSDLIDNAIKLVKDKFWAGGSIFDASSWIDTFTAKDRPIGKLLNWLFSPNGTEIQDAGNHLKEMLGGEVEDVQNDLKTTNTTPDEVTEAEREAQQKKIADEKARMDREREQKQKAEQQQKQRQEDVARRASIIPDLKAQQEQQRAAQKAAEENKKAADAAKSTVDAVEITAEKTEEYADNTAKTATALELGAKSADETGAGMVRIVDDTGHWYDVTVEQAKAMIGNGEATEAAAGSIESATGSMSGMIGTVQEANQNMVQSAGNAATVVPIVQKAETEVKEETGEVTAAMEETVENGVTDAGDTADESGGWIGSKIWNGIINFFKGANTGELGNAISGAINGVTAPFSTNVHSGNQEDRDKAFDEWYKSEIASYRNRGVTIGDALDVIADPAGTDPTTNPTGTGKTKTSSAKQKTVGEQIVEAYKTKLEANKLLRETADNEYALWKAENENTATADELMAKRAENAAKEISIQSDRVALAQQKYDALLSKWGKEKTETKEAYNELLQEKTSLAELKASQYTAIFEEADKLYDTNLETLEKEYDLASVKTERTATKKEKLNKETDYQKKRLDELEKKEENARKQWEYLTGEAGLAETDQRVIEAYQAYLEAQTDTQEVRNEIAEKQLEAVELEIEQLETAQKLATSRMEMLQKVYDDGDLSGRADAYKQAVETYGEDSPEARKARLQGTTSSILAAVSAVKNLNSQMQQTEELEKKLAEAAEKDKDGIRQEILDSQTAFLGFAENLADALNLDDSGKRAMLKVANGLQKNWKKIAQSMGNAWNKATENNPQLAEAGSTMAKIMGEAFSETGMEIGTECVSTIVSLMQGDWANALASAFSLMLDLMANEQVQDFMANLIADVGNGLNELGLNFTNLAKLAKNSMGSEGVAGKVAESTGMIEQAVQGSGGLEGILSNLAGMLGKVGSSIGGMLGDLGTVIAGFIGEFWPYILAAVAIVGALAGIAALFRKKKGGGSPSEEARQAGVDYPTEYEKGIREGTPKVEQAVQDMTDTANDIALSAAQSIANVLDDDADYEPTIRPVVDLTEVADSVDEVNSAFAGEKPLTLDTTVSRRIANEVDASPAIQNGARSYSDANVLSAIGALGDHMDAVGESIRGMKMVVDGRKTIGYIDSQLGRRAAQT